MSPQQIKENLMLYRAGTQDENDPEMMAALREAARDPELHAWLNQQQAFNLVVRDRLRHLQPPSDFKQRILAHPASVRKIVWWKRPEFLAVAAIIVMLFCLVSYWVTSKDQYRLADLRLRMAKYALTRYRMDIATNNMSVIRTYLTAKGGHGDYALPAGLGQLPGAGCALLSWQNQPVSLVCFQLSPKDLVWLFVIDRTALSDPPPPSHTQFEPVGKLMTATWTQGGKTYLLAGIGDKALIQQFL
jgi:uncharacterized membrane protein YbaN (DUF454 family)